MKLRLSQRIIIVLLPCIFFVQRTAPLPCSYKPPGRNEVLPSVLLEPEHHLRKRSISDNWGPLRIAVFYDDASLNRLSDNYQRLIKEVVLPAAVKFWSETLQVLRSTAPIRLHRKCQSNAAGEYKVHYPDPKDLRVFFCDQGCDEQTFCGDAVVPDSHLLRCLFLNPQRMFMPTSGPLPDGPGVPDTDFVLYVSTLETPRCNESKTVAYAAHCQQEMTYDRPIAGHANLCPRAISSNPSDLETLISTVKHEILHALGFSVALFAFFRDSHTGEPRTPREKFGRPSWNQETNTYQWSDSTIKNVERKDWQVRGQGITRSMKMLVTPRVVEEVRMHFGCDELEGAELENQGGEGTVLTHWEKRVFENEAMTGVHTQNPVYSRITFAVLEDSGWYKADYSAAEVLSFGLNLGCDFAMKSCKSWMDKARTNSYSGLGQPYCGKLKSLADNMIKTECSPTRTASSICNLTPLNQPLPPEYQNFDSIPGVPDDKVAQYGGSVDLADYCPFMQEFTWKSSSGAVRGARCTIEENQPDPSMNFALERYGKGSICVDQDSPWSERTCSMVRTWQHWGSGCYQHSCENGRVHISVNNRTFICYTAGQRLQLQILGNEWLHTGSIICPSCATVCQGRGGFTCLPDMPMYRDQEERNTWDFLDCGASNDIPLSVIPVMTSVLISLLTYIHLIAGSKSPLSE